MHAVMTRGVWVIEYNKGLRGIVHKGGDDKGSEITECSVCTIKPIRQGTAANSMDVPYILVHGMHAVMTRGVWVIEYNKGLQGMAHKGGYDKGSDDKGRLITTTCNTSSGLLPLSQNCTHDIVQIYTHAHFATQFRDVCDVTFISA